MPFERGGTKREKNFLAMESVNSLRISAPQWWPLREGRDGKCEGRNEKCEFLARESVNSSPIVRIFGKGKCNSSPILARPWWRHFRLSLFLSLSLSLSPKVPHAQYRKRFRASYNMVRTPSIRLFPPHRRKSLFASPSVVSEQFSELHRGRRLDLFPSSSNFKFAPFLSEWTINCLFSLTDARTLSQVLS